MCCIFLYQRWRRKQKKIAVSGDVRLSTSRLKKDFISGLIKSGIDVVDIGILPTPVNYFANYNLSIDGSVQITGSHNPKNYNGIKLVIDDKPVSGLCKLVVCIETILRGHVI